MTASEAKCGYNLYYMYIVHGIKDVHHLYHVHVVQVIATFSLWRHQPPHLRLVSILAWTRCAVSKSSKVFVLPLRLYEPHPGQAFQRLGFCANLNLYICVCTLFILTRSKSGWVDRALCDLLWLRANSVVLSLTGLLMQLDLLSVSLASLNFVPRTGL